MNSDGRGLKRSPNSSSLPHVEVWIEINFNQGPSTWSRYQNMFSEVRKRIARKYCVGDSNRIERLILVFCGNFLVSRGKSCDNIGSIVENPTDLE